MLIGITGAAGAGKDTAAQSLVDNYNFEKCSFARPLKEMLCKLLRVPMPMWEDREWKEAPILFGKSPRELTQTLGTEWGRQLVHPDLWVEMALRYAPERAVFSDVRFPNEAEAVRARGGKVVRVVATGKGTLTKHTAHASEIVLDDALIDHTIAVPRGAIARLQLAMNCYVLEQLNGESKMP